MKSLISVEHDRRWFEAGQQAIDQKGIPNVRLVLCPVEQETAAEAERYLAILNDMQQDSIDFALVDGKFRDLCACRLVPLMREGGVLVIDNVNWFLPCNSRAPNSIPIGAQPATPGWSEFQELVKKWRCVWTSDGVTDTAIFRKGT
jgi:predicted O-methyltransferase YrrM